MQPIIKVENLGKRYLIGHQSAQSERYVALRDVITRGVKDVARKTVEAFRGQQILQGDEVEEFWALRDVSFEVGQGEVVGIIGRNGAGKSTLLKVLSRITEPSAGRVTIRGRVASLLEVGTGFHPELTGRENIFLNGAILGMTKQEIRNKFDEIVAFAEIEKFIDTPVKRYSSGMYVRLAFAVAAHLEPEILIVDEVLAVGDAQFQQKCISKMQDVGRGGRTVLFVSHNLGAVQSLCGRAILLDSGGIVADDGVGPVLSQYSSRLVRSSALPFKGPLLGTAEIVDISVTAPGAPTGGPFMRQADIVISATLRAYQELADIQAFAGLTANGTRVCTMAGFSSRRTLGVGDTAVSWTVPAWFLRPGTYQVSMGATRKDGHDWLWTEQAVTLEILEQWRSPDDKTLAGLVTCPDH